MSKKSKPAKPIVPLNPNTNQPYPVIDSHTHIHYCKDDIETIIENAANHGVISMLNVGTDAETSQLCVDLANTYDSVFAVIGIHPNESEKTTPQSIAHLEKLCAEPKVLGIGETGLDWYRNGAPRDIQFASFKEHIRIAKEYDKTLVIHDRDAHDDIVQTLLKEAPPQRVVFHCFSGGPDLVEICAKHGWYMSFAGNVTFKNATELHAAATAAPKELILVETDAPYMTPTPHRGKSNEPQYVGNTMLFIADLKNLNPVEFAEQTIQNTHSAFPGLNV